MQTIQLNNGGQFEANITIMGNAFVPSIKGWFGRSEFQIVQDEVTERNRALSRASAAMAMKLRQS
jgi:hypothetical protein